MRNTLCAALSFMTCIATPTAWGFRTGVAGGSVGVGTGHSNAADFRGLLGYKLHYSFRNNLDLSLSPTHILIGRVYPFRSGAYVAPAMGFIADAHDSGFGISSAFGFDFLCWGVCVYSELQQQLGYGSRRKLISGYAFRIGIDYSNQ
jgi:hypothetical protein